MNTSALVVMLLTIIGVTSLTLYFFIKVLTTPKRPEPDSFSENDDDINGR